MAGTWVRKVDGKIHQLVVKKLEATWSGPWMYNKDTDDWEATTSVFGEKSECKCTCTEG
jgi:hypothetical protein